MSAPSLGLVVGLSLLVQVADPTGLSLASRNDRAPVAEAPAQDGASTEAASTDGAAAGDLDAALEQARAAREAEPNASNWAAEAAALEARGELVAAKEAYAAALEADGADAIDASAVEAKIEALDEQSRGRVADEPASTHREELDEARAERNAPPPEPAPVDPEPAPKRDIRVVDKWYFWVTLAAIVASAGAITGIAIKAASDERKDSLDRSAPLPDSPAVLRF